MKRMHTTAEQRNVAVIQHMYACFNAGDDYSWANELVAPDAINHALPPGCPHGRDGMVWMYNAYRGAFADTRDQLEELLADGDKVITRVRHTGRHVDEFFGIPATGKQVDYTSTFIWRLARAQIIEVWGDTDRLGLLRQLGARLALPDPGEPATSSSLGSRP